MASSTDSSFNTFVKKLATSVKSAADAGVDSINSALSSKFFPTSSLWNNAAHTTSGKVAAVAILAVAGTAAYFGIGMAAVMVTQVSPYPLISAVSYGVAAVAGTLATFASSFVMNKAINLTFDAAKAVSNLVSKAVSSVKGLFTKKGPDDGPDAPAAGADAGPDAPAAGADAGPDAPAAGADAGPDAPAAGAAGADAPAAYAPAAGAPRSYVDVVQGSKASPTASQQR